MTFQQELSSWSTPTAVEIFPAPEVGGTAPSTRLLSLPSKDGKPVVVTFLRHCGCPYAEKTFITTRKLADAHPEVKIIAVSHSDQPATDKWLEAVGGAGKVEVLIDADRTTFGKWGLGLSGWWQVINPWSMMKLVQMGRQEGIWNRPTESGSRWQTAGTFAVDRRGNVTYAKVASQAADVCDPVPAAKTVT